MKNYKNKAIVLGISGNGLGIVRSLGRRGVDVTVVSDTDTSTNLFSRYIYERWFFYGNDKELVEELLNRGPSFSEKPVLFPVRDATVLALSEKIDEIKKYYQIIMPSLEIVKGALCKTTFAQMAEKFGLPVPRSFSIGQGKTISDLPNDFKFPVIVKPEYRNDNYVAHVSGKAFKAENILELTAFYEMFSNLQEEAIIQEYIPGDDSDLFFCFQYYTTDQSLACSLSGRKIRQYPSLCGSTCSCELVRASQVEELTTSFFTQIGYVGPCSMEFKRDPRDGAYYFIEPTIGRHDWNNAFGEGNGFPMPYINYLDAAGGILPQCKQKRFLRRWIRWSADFETAKTKMKQGDLSVFGWIKSIRPPVTGAIFAVDDLKPFIVYLVRRIKRKVEKLIFHWEKTVRKKLRKIYLREKYIVFKKRIDEQKLPVLDDRFVFRESVAEDIPTFVDAFKPHYDSQGIELIANRIKDGEFLILGFLKENPRVMCMHAWLSEKDKFFLEESKLHSMYGEVCNYKALVLEQYRNIGFSRQSKLYLEHFAAEKKYNEIVCYTKSNNYPQLKVADHVGSIRVGFLYRTIIFGKEFINIIIK
ncbi:MAG: hypothetical protein B6I37_06060 [Desulfobacteraceae bacterium 4572_35.2]|nr:MAG: hypothetical protein B6I37_06060 [Desulfobacteraceae bacterium 4572_35.2]